MIPAMSGAGGAERTMAYLLDHLTNHHDVTLLTLEASESEAFFPVPSSVRTIGLDKLGGRRLSRFARVISRPLLVRQEVSACSPDVILSFMDTMNVVALIGCVGLGAPVVVSERNDPALHRVGRAKELLRDSSYALAKIVVVPTERVARYFPSHLSAKLRVVPNPVPQFADCAQPDRPDAKGRLRIIAVGRLEPHKGLASLVTAFAQVSQEHPDWDLLIIGEGRQRAELEALVRLHRLEGRVNLPGVVKDAGREIRAAHLMAFPSRYEGFPNALAEGLALGLPAIGLLGVSGVEELIVSERTGLIVGGTPDDWSSALSALMRCSATRKRLGQAARSHVQQWAPSKVLPAWEAILYEAAGRKLVPANLRTIAQHEGEAACG